MAKPLLFESDQIFAIDIGATFIKFGLTDSRGVLLEEVRRILMPYPCSPERLVTVVVREIMVSGCSRVGVGFPGEFKDGHVIQPGNLARPGGITTDVDPILEGQWRGFDLQRALVEASHRDVRVVNDATLAALGCCEGVGNELVLTLGTGLGIALVVNGGLNRIRDVGAEVFVDGRTYDQLVGDFSKSQDEDRWRELLHRAVSNFATEFAAHVVHLGGGNAKKVDPTIFDDLACRVVINENDATLRGAAKLFDGSVGL